MQRILHFIAHELIGNRLANSKSFQNAAVKTHQHLQKSQDLIKEGTKKLNSQKEEASKHGANFWSEFKDELVKRK